MGRYKCAYSCESSGDSDVKFFKFPLYNPRKLKKWLDNMKWEDWTPSRFSVLCINHFEDQYIDRTGKFVKLRADAVPTIFASPDDTQKMKASIKPRSKRHTSHGAKALQTSPSQSSTNSSVSTKRNIQNKETNLTEEDPAGDKDSKKCDKWRIIVDEGLMKIESFPHFFHGDYCVPQDIQWAPDSNVSMEYKDPENVIEVGEPWQWLGLDVRGPLPQTANEHKYILTVTDYYSKWVEAVPMQSCLPPHVAKHIVDIIAHFGYPLRILSRLPHDIVHKINRELKDQLKVTVTLVVYHQQTGTADLVTQQLIDRMVSDLVEEHAADWDVYLPAKVFSLCFKEHSKTKKRPFSVLCCGGLEPVHSPRGLNYAYSKIRESAFVVR
ncbi:THAP domain-containing protein [Anabas testudineus]|uniref:THAP-type domain-containing protein n=1 Tax=Anabas testudineus TaxID=64144 RepID=A0A3Q1JD39_ANATE|nr:THAP domain-containing protein [Anabas testudineus]